MVVKGQEQAVKVEAMITPTIEAMGYDVVRVMIAGGQSVMLQVMAERHDGKAMTVEDCAEISRTVSALLEVEDPITGPYRLEVSSPGIDRPLTKARDFERFAGSTAKIKLAVPLAGRRNFTGVLSGMQDGRVKVQVDGEIFELDFEHIERARLVPQF